jgi:hypothetical protein
LFTLPFCVDMAGADSEPTRPGSDVLASTSAARRPAPEYVHAARLCLVSQPCRPRTRARRRAAASEMRPLATARRLADRSAAWRAGIQRPTWKNGRGRPDWKVVSGETCVDSSWPKRYSSKMASCHTKLSRAGLSYFRTTTWIILRSKLKLALLN